MPLAKSLLLGTSPNNQRYSASVRLGGVNATPVEIDLDPYLASLGQDPNNHYNNRDFVVIPHGRLVAWKQRDLTDQDRRGILTMANGVDPTNKPSFAKYASTPFGYAPYHIFKNFAGMPADAPLGVRHETIAMPYTSVSESYNDSDNGGARLIVGEYVMPFYGSASKQKANAVHAGKMVRYIGRRVLTTVAGTASAVVLLDAKYPAFLPKILLAWKADSTIVTSGATLSYSEADGKWKATFSDTVKAVMFEYGPSDQQRIGQIYGIEPVKDAGGINSGANHEIVGWLKWVQTKYGQWEYPLILDRRDTTSVTDEAVSVSNNAGILANTPVVPFKAVTVKVTGTRIESDGTETALTDEVLEAIGDDYFGDHIHGEEFDLDILTGRIEFANNLVVTSAKVSYYYEVDFREGKDWDGLGIAGLTDGSGPSGIVGIPPHLDVAGVYGELRVAIL